MCLVQLTEIVGFFKSVPDVIWSGLIASVITLSGVFLSNISNNNRLKLQLKHDADEKTIERTTSLRREVYLRAVEELVKANSHLSSLPQIDVTKTNLADGLQGFFTAAARLQLVAEPKTSLLVSQLSANYGELVFKLMTDLIPVMKAKQDIEIADDFYNRTQTEINRILAEQRKINESGNQNPAAFQSLQSNFQFEQEQAAKYSADKSEGWERFNQHNITFQKHLLTELKEISSKQIPVMVEIRRDLGLTGDLSEVEAHMKQLWIRMEAHFDALIVALESSLKS
jgi:hypothetical protein